MKCRPMPVVALFALSCLGSVLFAQDENLALLGASSQTTTCYARPASFGNDGNLGNESHTCEGNEALGEPVWELDLGGEPMISQIVVHNRVSCCGSRLRDIVISVHNTPYLEGGVIVGDPIFEEDIGVYEWDDAEWQSELLNPENELGEFPLGPGSLTVDLDPPVAARYVRVTRIPDPDLSGSGGQGNAGEPDVLSIGDIEVYGEGGFECPADGELEFGDTDCEAILVDPPAGGNLGDGGTYTVTGIADDGTGDPVIYTFFADSEAGQQMVSGPSTADSATFELLFGTWTFSVEVDDDGRCDDQGDDVTCVADPIEIAGDDNLALGKPTWHSSQLGGFAPGLAVDGNLGNFTHTLAGNNGLGPATWEVDLLEMSEIASIEIFNRTSCCGSRLRDIIVSIHDVSAQDDPLAEALWESELLNPENIAGAFPLGPPILTVAPDEPVLGQYVRITRIADDDLSGSGGQGNLDEATVLSLGEVEIFGVPSDCPAEGDTHCEDLVVDPAVETIDGEPGVYQLTAFADDDSGDEPTYTFEAREAGGDVVTVGPLDANTTSVTLTEGTWTLTVKVDDDRCPDEAKDAICSLEKIIACAGEADTHCELIEIVPPLDSEVGNYEVIAFADDDSGDPMLYTFSAVNALVENMEPLVIGPQDIDRAIFFLGVGEWTISVSVDDDLLCSDVADDATCSEELTIAGDPDNLAFGKPATQSTTGFGGVASRAVDGNTSGIYGENSITHTAAGDPTPWWEVDLLASTEVENVTIWGRVAADCCADRLTNFRVSVLDDARDEVWSEDFFPLPEGGFPDTTLEGFRIDVGGAEGRIVRIDRLGTPEDYPGQFFLSIAEVQVSGDDDIDPPVGPLFNRGDADSSGSLNLTDGIFILNFLFLGSADPTCMDAADADDSGVVNLTDGIFLLNFLFLGGDGPMDPGSPPAPCGVDRSKDTLDCAVEQPHCNN